MKSVVILVESKMSVFDTTDLDSTDAFDVNVDDAEMAGYVIGRERLFRYLTRDLDLKRRLWSEKGLRFALDMVPNVKQMNKEEFEKIYR